MWHIISSDMTAPQVVAQINGLHPLSKALQALTAKPDLLTTWDSINTFYQMANRECQDT